MFLALLERLPSLAAGTPHERPPGRLADTLTSVVERGFLNSGT
jgi:hypothetical protein